MAKLVAEGGYIIFLYFQYVLKYEKVKVIFEISIFDKHLHWENI